MRIGGGAVSIADVTDRTLRDLGFVREFWLNEIRAGRAFMGGTSLAASVGNYSQIQLHNPAGSGITVLAKAIYAGMGAAGFLNLKTHNTALGANITTFANLLSGGAGPVADLRTAQPAAQAGSLIGIYLRAGNLTDSLVPDWNLELGEGEGAMVETNAVNIDLVTTFLWVEL